MAVSVVAVSHGTDVTSNATGITVALPDGSNVVGRRLVVCVVKDGSGAVTWPSGWNVVNEGAGDSNALYVSVRYRDIDGTEGYPSTGATISCTGANEEWGAFAILIAGHDAGTAPEAVSATGATSGADWPSLDPSWDSSAEETLWIVFGGWDAEPSHGANAVPSGWSNRATDNTAGATHGITHCRGTLISTTAAQNPAASTVGAENWRLVTVGVRPAVPVTAEVDQTLPTLTGDVTTDVVVDGTASASLAAVTQGADGTLTVAVASSAALTSLSQDAAGSVEVEAPTGDIAQTLPTLDQAATGAAEVNGEAAATLPVLGQDATAAAAVGADTAQTLPALSQDATGSANVAGSADTALPPFAQDASGSLDVEGQAANALTGLAQSAAGAAVVESQGGQTLPTLSQDAAGNVNDDAVAGAADQTLPPLDQAASGDASVYGSAAQGLPAFGAAADGVLVVTADAAGMLGALAQAAGGTLTVAGDGATVLPGPASDAAGFVAGGTLGTIAQTLPAIAQVPHAWVAEPGLPSVRVTVMRLLVLAAGVDAQRGRGHVARQWKDLRSGADVVLTRSQLEMFEHPALPDLATSELWRLTGASTLTPAS